MKNLRVLFLSFFYLLWIEIFLLMSQTVVMFVLARQNVSIPEISEVFASNALFLATLGAILFTILLCAAYPLSETRLDMVISWDRIKRHWATGAVRGVALALGVGVTYVLFDLYSSLGFLIQVEDRTFLIFGFVMRCGALVLLTYCEEYIFRGKILEKLRSEFKSLYAIVAVSILYVVIKQVQFPELSLMQTLTLFLISLRLSLKSTLTGDFTAGAGEFAGLLVMLQLGMSLPVFGNEFQGLWMFQAHAKEGLDNQTARLIGGGIGGPLSSLGLQVLLVFDVMRTLFRNKKVLL